MTRRRTKLYVAFTLGLLSSLGLFYLGVEWWTSERPNYSEVEEGLYMGGSVRRPPPGTTAVLNLCETPDPYQPQVHAWEPIPDAEPAPTLDWLRQRVQFIAELRHTGRVVYVHCQNGVSRSSMVVTAYLMDEHGWPRDQALEFLCSRRAGVRPNPAFLALLAEWERR
jgi:protein-tyrosine phosphatase